jgi:hypothetical protein
MNNVIAITLRSILSVCTAWELDIKFAVCLSTLQSERLISFVLRLMHLFYRKNRQMRSVVDYDASWFTASRIVRRTTDRSDGVPYLRQQICNQ